jgi:hypothetical protein
MFKQLRRSWLYVSWALFSLTFFQFLYTSHCTEELNTAPTPSPPIGDHVKRRFEAPKRYVIDQMFAKNELVRAELEKRGWTEKRKERRLISMGTTPNVRTGDFNFLWTFDRERTKINWLNDPYVNHFTNFEEIGTKIGLWKNLYRAAREAQSQGNASFVDPATFFPRCYLLAKIEQERAGLENVEKTTTAEGQWEVWGLSKAEVEQEKARFTADFYRTLAGPTPQGGEKDGHYSNVVSCISTFNEALTIHPLQPAIDGSRNIWIAKPSIGARGTGMLVMFFVVFFVLFYFLPIILDIRLFNDIHKLFQYTGLLFNTSHSLSSSNLEPLNYQFGSTITTDSMEKFSTSEACQFNLCSFIVQKYVERPLLIDGLKFDIRQFVLVASLDPLVIFINDDFYLRFTTSQFSLDNLEDRFLHLTNHQVQKESQHFEAAPVPESQWSSIQFKQYLEKKFGVRTWEERIKQRLDQIIVSTLRAWPHTGHRKNRFEVLGFDILLDEDLGPWLLEVNTDPGLHLLTDIVRVHHPQFVSSLFKVILDNREVWMGAPETSDVEAWTRFQQQLNNEILFGSLRLVFKGHKHNK